MAARRVTRDGTGWIAAVVAMVLVAVLGAASGAQAAQAAGTASPDDQAALAAALVRDFGISEKQALTNVELQARAGDIVGALEKSLGDGYAGVWFDDASGQFRIGVAPSTDEQASRRLRRLASYGVEKSA